MEETEPSNRRNFTGGTAMVGILYFVTKEESIKQSEEPESNKAENDKGTSDPCMCVVSGIVSDCKERAAALRVTSVMARYWSTQLQSRAEASELRTIFPAPWRNWKYRPLQRMQRILAHPEPSSSCCNPPTYDYPRRTCKGYSSYDDHVQLG